MAERKVLVKYYPPDFDPELLPRNRRPRDQKIVVRMMLPFSVQCKTCGEYIYRGKKFNSRKEEVIGKEYLGIKIWRFYFKCTNCAAELTFITDPEHSDYICEHGATRNFEPWRAQASAEEEAKAQKEEEEKDVMKQLENRTEQSKREMDMLDFLEELRDRNNRLSRVDVEAALEARARHYEELEKEQEAQDRIRAQQAFASRIRRLAPAADDVDEVAEEEEYEDDSVASSTASTPTVFSGMKTQLSISLDSLIEFPDEQYMAEVEWEQVEEDRDGPLREEDTTKSSKKSRTGAAVSQPDAQDGESRSEKKARETQGR
eukprot:TRINITY_DN5750_c0_g2_i2.p1 TRINITY_DN5750_c0_g2~~TRINITY_DN5750_c0_g2_i2.p1  ORF type:complete len:317 (-),score=83.99 TRINITY_DN5750_c0_g2_i2:37-987(-)